MKRFLLLFFQLSLFYSFGQNKLQPKVDLGLGVGFVHDFIYFRGGYHISDWYKIGAKIAPFNGVRNLSYSNYGIESNIFLRNVSKLNGVRNFSIFQDLTHRRSHNNEYMWQWFIVSLGMEYDVYLSKRSNINFKLGGIPYARWKEKNDSNQSVKKGFSIFNGVSGDEISISSEPAFYVLPIYFSFGFNYKI